MRSTKLTTSGHQPESAIQELFDQWASRKPGDGWLLAGVPAWLDDVHEDNVARRRRAAWNDVDLGYAYQPDVEWADFVIELKSGAKHEPLAIAEVLHHRALLEHAGSPKTPVVVSQYNAWSRATLWQLLRAGGLAGLRYVEHTSLQAVGDDRSEYLLLSEPLADWRECRTPPEDGLDDREVKGTWYEASDGPLWVKSTAAPRPGERDPFQTERYQLVARVEGKSRSFISWSGHDGVDGSYTLREFG